MSDIANKLQAGKLPDSTGGIQTARFFNMTCLTYSNSRQIILEPTCFGWMVTNIGDAIISVKGKRLYPSATPATSAGDGFAVGGHVLDLYRGTLEIAVTPGTAAPLYEVTQVFYAEAYSR